ncbi:GntR family transcriptional regulator [Paenibacillus doosanensis]|uniref:GntR family transcriptional regulator n=1 Tax=Paenibacillus doosanensis TaxID=1229154 RepID=UPI0021806A65|nr:GntR family transcriptional regulator [Paenibacillus doosanensis]MCS7464036.1 GntR family transcriptional regulator [Paenibacillus doosanensis]
MNSIAPGEREYPQLTGLAKPSLEKLAYQQIREHIINGHYLPGLLLSENELAERLGMSRTPIRAAISLLETEGFVEAIRGRGVFVKDITFREFLEMFEVLSSLQLYSLDIAAVRKLGFDLPTLEGHLERQLRASEEDDYRTYYESGLLFIETMLHLVKNASMLQIIEQIKGKYMFKIISYRKLHVQALPKPQQSGHFNKRIYQALAAGELDEAKRIVLELVELVRQQFQSFNI